MKGFDIYKRALSLLAYNDILEAPSLQSRFEEQGAEIVSQIAAELKISEIQTLAADFEINTLQSEALVYGTAMLLSLAEGDSSKNRIFTAIYNAKRAAALKCITKIGEAMPHTEVDGQ